MNTKSEKNLHIIIAGGGTGGHVFPAIAIREAISSLRPDSKCIFVGTKRGAESIILARTGETLKTLWISGFSRRHVLKNLLLPIKLFVSLLQSFSLILRFKPDVVIGTGGYVMGPIMWLSQRMKIPNLLQEQNSIPGYTTRSLAKRANILCLGFSGAASKLASTRAEVTGNPLRASFRTLSHDEARSLWDLDYSRKTILIFGGSAGARSINETMAIAVGKLCNEFNIIWQTGHHGVPQTSDQRVMSEAHRQKHLIVQQFIDEMPAAYAVADLAVCRAGAMTLAELAVSGLPAILIPYPYATDDHQSANAQSYENAGAAVVVKDSDLTSDLLISTTRFLVQSEGRLQEMSRSMKQLAKPNAAMRIAQLAIDLARK